MSNAFSEHKQSAPKVQQGDDQDYDLIVIGGGVLGSFVFLEATQRGLHVLLLEKSDFFSGASANSLKTLHGGIRYLQSMNVRRVFESSSERSTIQHIAPLYTRPLSCLLPSQRKISKNRYAMFVGCMVYNLLAGRTLSKQPSAKHKVKPSTVLSGKKLRTISGFFSPERAAMFWQDAQLTNPERFGLAIVRTAVKLGSKARNYCAVESVRKVSNRLSPGSANMEVTVSNLECESVEKFYSKVVVDCTGDKSLYGGFLQAQGLVDPLQQYENVLAVNLILNRSIDANALALEAVSKDGSKRLLFFSPWYDKTMVGTWYFECADRESNQLAASELRECEDGVLSALNSAGVSVSRQEIKAEILDVHVGLLPAQKGKLTPEARLYQHTISHRSGAVSNPEMDFLIGNKLTTGRATAEKYIDSLSSAFPNLTDSVSAKTVLDGLGSDSESECSKLCERYGNEIAQNILTMITEHPELSDPIPGLDDYCIAEFKYVVEREWVCKLEDVIYRRLDAGTRQNVPEEAVIWMAEYAGEILSWSDSRIEREAENVLGKVRVKSLLFGSEVIG